MRYVTGNELMTLFRKGVPIVVEVSPEKIQVNDDLHHNGLCYHTDLSPGMRAEVVDVRPFEPPDADILEVVLDFLNYESYNRRFDLPNHLEIDRDHKHLDLKWCETKRYPKKVYNGYTIVRTTIYVNMGDIYEIGLLEDRDQELYQKFLESDHPSYTQWLEGLVNQLKEGEPK
jgi:hypothetical protein